eukprot:2844196-Prymnesium_polylepis.1
MAARVAERTAQEQEKKRVARDRAKAEGASGLAGLPDLATLKLVQLKELLRERGLPVSGVKAKL